MDQHLPRLYLAVSRSPGGEQKRPVAPSGRSFPAQRPQRVAPPLFGTGPARSTSHAGKDCVELPGKYHLLPTDGPKTARQIVARFLPFYGWPPAKVPEIRLPPQLPSLVP